MITLIYASPELLLLYSLRIGSFLFLFLSLSLHFMHFQTENTFSSHSKNQNGSTITNRVSSASPENQIPACISHRSNINSKRMTHDGCANNSYALQIHLASVRAATIGCCALANEKIMRMVCVWVRVCVDQSVLVLSPMEILQSSFELRNSQKCFELAIAKYTYADHKQVITFFRIAMYRYSHFSFCSQLRRIWVH